MLRAGPAVEGCRVDLYVYVPPANLTEAVSGGAGAGAVVLVNELDWLNSASGAPPPLPPAPP